MNPLEKSRSEDRLTIDSEQGGVRSPLSERVRSLRLPEQTISGGTSLQKLPWLLCAVLAIAVILLGYRALTSQAVSGNPGAGATTPAADALSAQSEASAPLPDGEIVLESKGYIIPAHQILISPKVTGMIVSLHVQEGQRVTKEAVLARLESVDYEAELSRAKATLALANERLRELENGNRPEEIQQARAELAEAEAQRVQLEAEWKRAQDLIKSNALPASDFEISESKYYAMVRRVERLRYALKLMEEGARKERRDAARAEVKQAEADVTKAQWRLDNCTIRAPITGTILKKNAEEGNIVNPIAFNGSYSICEMADLSDLEVDLTIQERDVSRISKGQRCKVRAEAYPNRVYEGVVSRLMPIADRAKGAIPVRVKLTVPADEEGIYLKPEMGATVSFFQVADGQKANAENRHGRSPASLQAAHGARSATVQKTKEPQLGVQSGGPGDRQSVGSPQVLPTR